LFLLTYLRLYVGVASLYYVLSVCKAKKAEKLPRGRTVALVHLMAYRLLSIATVVIVLLLYTNCSIIYVFPHGVTTPRPMLIE